MLAVEENVNFSENIHERWTKSIFTNKNWDFLYIQSSKAFHYWFTLSHDSKANEPKATFFLENICMKLKRHQNKSKAGVYLFCIVCYIW